MKKLAWVLVTVLTIIFTPVLNVHAASSEHGLLISELQTGSTNSATEEFVEIYNSDDQNINLNDYRLEYFSASSTDFTTPSRTIPLTGTLEPTGIYLIASKDYLVEQANTQFAATLAKTGGHIRLVRIFQGNTIVQDLVGWGNARMPEVMAAAAPDAGKSLTRTQVDELHVDTDNNNQDFLITVPSPQSRGVLPTTEMPEDPEDPVVPDEPTVPDPEEDPDDELPQTPTDPEPERPKALAVNITELLPNPASPKTDATDEFIEIFNPHSETVNLEGYRIETGSDSTYVFVFGARTIAPQSYLVLYATETNLTLANGGGKARILDPSGNVLHETAVYDTAKDNMSWSFEGSSWKWTTTATPGQTNVVTVKVDDSVLTKLKKAATSKSTKTTKPKTTTAKSPKVAAASSKASTKTNEDTQNGNPIRKPALQPAILIAVGALALGYVVYEYRSDIANLGRKLYRKSK